MNSDITGHEYEHVCAKKLKKQGFTNVKVTKGSGDQGIDIIAHKDGKKYGIQCKYYSSPVGNWAVQEAFAGSRYYDCDYAVVMTNTTFTKSAKELANKIGVELWEFNAVNSTSARKFSLWKIINYLVIVVGILGFITLLTFDMKHPILQGFYIFFMTMAGVFGVISVTMPDMITFSCIFYLLTIIFSLICDLVFKHSIGSDALILLVPFIISLIKFFIIANPKRDSTYTSEETAESIQKEIDEVVRHMGEIYSNFFMEHYFIKTQLLRYVMLNDNTYEFVYAIETQEQARYLIAKESEINANTRDKYAITLLANNCISLLVEQNK